MPIWPAGTGNALPVSGRLRVLSVIGPSARAMMVTAGWGRVWQKLLVALAAQTLHPRQP